MDASSYLRLALRWWWLLLLAIALGGGVAWLASARIRPTYRASSTLLVMRQAPDGTIGQGDLQASVLLADTLVRLITVRPVLEAVIEGGQLNLSARELRDRIVVQHARASQVIEIRATAADPGLAREIANGVATVTIASQSAAFPAGAISIVEPATTPTSPISPRRPMNAILGALLAVAACAVGLVLRERSDDTLKSVEDLQPLALPALGLLRPGTGEPGNRLPAAYYPDSDTADDYRRVGANLGAVLAQHSSMFERKVVLLTSAYPHSGAAVTANLAVVLGAAGYRVLIVDGDLREPTLHQVFSLPNGDGLAAGLLGDSAAIVRRIDIAHGGTTKEAASTGSAARDLPSSNGHTAPYSTVFVASAGSPPSSAGDLLGSPAMRSAIAEWREQYDFVLVQGPPLDRPDAAILATLADAVAVVVQAGGTRAGDLLPLIHQLGGTQSIFAGVILDSDRGEPSPQQEVSAEQLQMKVVARASGSRDG